MLINPLEAGVLIQSYVHDPHYISSRISGSSEAFASELPENPEEICLWYYVRGDMFGVSSTTQQCDIRRESIDMFNSAIRMTSI